MKLLLPAALNVNLSPYDKVGIVVFSALISPARETTFIFSPADNVEELSILTFSAPCFPNVIVSYAVTFKSFPAITFELSLIFTEPFEAVILIFSFDVFRLELLTLTSFLSEVNVIFLFATTFDLLIALTLPSVDLTSKLSAFAVLKLKLYLIPSTVPSSLRVPSAFLSNFNEYAATFIVALSIVKSPFVSSVTSFDTEPSFIGEKVVLFAIVTLFMPVVPSL